MPSLTVKNIPDDVYQRLKENASRHRRSLNSEVIVSLERITRARPVEVKKTLARIDELRKSIHIPSLTEEFLAEARHTGRP